MADEEQFLSEELNIFKDNPILNLDLAVYSNATDRDMTLIEFLSKSTLFKAYDQQKIPEFQENMDQLRKFASYNLLTNF
jgi:hypothetical protein